MLAAEARILVLHGRPEESRARCEEAIAIARSLGARAEEGHALNTLGLGLLLVGERTGAIARLNESRRIAEDCSPEDLWRAYANLGEALEQDGRVEEAVELGLEGAELVRPLGQRNWGAYILGQVASQLVRLGRLDEAERLTATGLETRIEGIDTAILKSVVSEISLLRGNPKAAATEPRARGKSGRADNRLGDPGDARRPPSAGGRARRRTRTGRWRCVDEAIAAMDDGEYLFYTARMYALAVRAHADARSAPEPWATPRPRRKRNGRAPRSSSGSSGFSIQSGGWVRRRPSRWLARRWPPPSSSASGARRTQTRGAPSPPDGPSSASTSSSPTPAGDRLRRCSPPEAQRAKRPSRCERRLG